MLSPPYQEARSFLTSPSCARWACGGSVCRSRTGHDIIKSAWEKVMFPQLISEILSLCQRNVKAYSSRESTRSDPSPNELTKYIPLFFFLSVNEMQTERAAEGHDHTRLCMWKGSDMEQLCGINH